MKQLLQRVISPLNWPPMDYGIEGEGGSPKFFEQEEWTKIGLFISLIVLGSMIFIGVFGVLAVLFNLKALDELNLWFLVKGATTFAFLAVAFHMLMRHQFHRKVDENQFQAMIRWHHQMPELPKPNRSMNKRDLAQYVQAAYKAEKIRRDHKV